MPRRSNDARNQTLGCPEDPQAIYKEPEQEEQASKLMGVNPTRQELIEETDRLIKAFSERSEEYCSKLQLPFWGCSLDQTKAYLDNFVRKLKEFRDVISKETDDEPCVIEKLSKLMEIRSHLVETPIFGGEARRLGDDLSRLFQIMDSSEALFPKTIGRYKKEEAEVGIQQSYRAAVIAVVKVVYDRIKDAYQEHQKLDDHENKVFDPFKVGVLARNYRIFK